MGMMRQAIQGGAGQQVIAERLGPFFEGPVAGDDQRAMLVAFTTSLFILRGSFLVSNNAR